MQLEEAAASPPAPAAAVDSDGSLWQAGSSLNGMFIDTKARNIGDIVTVKINESAKATNKAKTETEPNVQPRGRDSEIVRNGRLVAKRDFA